MCTTANLERKVLGSWWQEGQDVLAVSGDSCRIQSLGLKHLFCQVLDCALSLENYSEDAASRPLVWASFWHFMFVCIGTKSGTLDEPIGILGWKDRTEENSSVSYWEISEATSCPSAVSCHFTCALSELIGCTYWAQNSDSLLYVPGCQKFIYIGINCVLNTSLRNETSLKKLVSVTGIAMSFLSVFHFIL